jgi:hypothetical protein
MEDVPEIFLPVGVVLRNGQTSYNNLRDVRLTIKQKSFICSQISHDFSVYPDFIGAVAGNQFVERYNLVTSTVWSWLKKFKEPNGILHEYCGKPTLPDEQGVKDALQEIFEGVADESGRKDKKRLMTEIEVQACFNKHARLSKVRKGRELDPNDPHSAPPIAHKRM